MTTIESLTRSQVAPVELRAQFTLFNGQCFGWKRHVSPFFGCLQLHGCCKYVALRLLLMWLLSRHRVVLVDIATLALEAVFFLVLFLPSSSTASPPHQNFATALALALALAQISKLKLKLCSQFCQCVRVRAAQS
jgi:hypothetical protein